MRYSFLFVFILFSCTNTTKNLIGTWVSECNPAIKIRFTEEGYFENSTSGEWMIEQKFFEQQEDGKLIEIDYGKIKYETKEFGDSLIVLLTGEKNSKLYARELFFVEKHQLISVTYKEGPGIDDHIQVIGRFTKEGKKAPLLSRKPTMSFYLPEDFEGKPIYVAYNQPDGINPKIGEDGNISIEVPANGILKTSVKENIKIIANRNLKFYRRQNGEFKPLNALFESDICRIRAALSKGTSKENPLDILFNPNSVVVIVLRFNPGRERVVNKVFGESIKGNVQTFTIDTLKNELQYFGFDINKTNYTFGQ